jgi:hypothetical protein
MGSVVRGKAEEEEEGEEEEDEAQAGDGWDQELVLEQFNLLHSR